MKKLTDRLFEKRGGEPILIKVGDSKVKLGQFSKPPKVDCRVVAEDLYQDMIRIINKWDELDELIGGFYETDDLGGTTDGDLTTIGEICASKLGYL
jgi:hypothetical protein